MLNLFSFSLFLFDLFFLYTAALEAAVEKFVAPAELLVPPEMDIVSNFSFKSGLFS